MTYSIHFTLARKALQDFHMPFNFDDSRLVEKKEDIELLLQEGFINRYSKIRKTPIFTAQKLDGESYKELKENVKQNYCIMYSNQ